VSETIKDGKGRGYLAEVSERNKIMMDSVMQSEEADIAGLGYSFVVSTKVLTLNSTNPHLFLYFKNTNSEKNMHIQVVRFGWNGGSTNHNRTMTWGWVIAPGEPTANHTAVTSGNLNFTSNQVAEALVYKWDGVGDGMTYTGGFIASEAIYTQGYNKLEAHGIPIVGLNDSFGMILTGEEIGNATITMRFFYKDK
jgi:hypothetical protein